MSIEVFLFKFKLYIVAMIAAIFAGGVRAASMKRKGKAPTLKDTFYYVIMTIVITGMAAGLILYFGLPVNEKTLFGYGFLFVFIGQFTDLIYLKAGQNIASLLDKYKPYIKKWKLSYKG